MKLIGISILSMGLGLVAVFLALRQPPTPIEAAERTFTHALNGDTSWLFEHAAKKEADFVKPLIMEEFYRELVEPLVRGAKIESTSKLYSNQNKGLLVYRLALPSGERIQAIGVGYSEDGRLVSPVMDSLMWLYAAAKHRNIRGLPGQLKAARAGEMGVWFKSHGVSQWFDSQSDSFVTFK